MKPKRRNPKHSQWMKEHKIIPPSRKGIKLSEEHKIKIREHSTKFWLGKKLSLETRKKISEAHKGIPGYWQGKKRPDISSGQLGEKNKMWRGGITPISLKIRNSPEYKRWRREVLERDGECVDCGSITNLQAHHIIPQSVDETLRFELSNGITLCFECHKKTDNFGGNAIKFKNK